MSSEAVGIPHSDLTEVRTTLNPLTLEFTPVLASHLLSQWQSIAAFHTLICLLSVRPSVSLALSPTKKLLM